MRLTHQSLCSIPSFVVEVVKWAKRYILMKALCKASDLIISSSRLFQLEEYVMSFELRSDSRTHHLLCSLRNGLDERIGHPPLLWIQSTDFDIVPVGSHCGGIVFLWDAGLRTVHEHGLRTVHEHIEKIGNIFNCTPHRTGRIIACANWNDIFCTYEPMCWFYRVQGSSC